MPKFYIIDGNSLLFRAFYATSYRGELMATKSGQPTNAIFAFGGMITKILKEVKKGDALFVGFDADGHTFRKEEFSDYKANRKPAPQELVSQFAPARELLDSLGILRYEEHGIEADDICGTLAKSAKKKGYKVHIFTSDRDYLQLIEDNIEVEILKRGLSETQLVTNKNMVELYGFEPLQMIDYKALAGDSSDNIPGIPGIGEKKALALIQEYGSFEEIVKAAPNIKGALGEKIRANVDLGYQSYHLATIICDAKLPFKEEDCIYEGYSSLKMETYCNKYELKTLLRNLPVDWAAYSGEAADFQVVDKAPASILEAKDLYLHLEVANEYHEEKPRNFALHDGSKTYILEGNCLENDEVLIKALEDENIAKHVNNSKALAYYLKEKGHDLKGLKDDLLIAAYLIDSSFKGESDALYYSFGIDTRSDDENTSIASKAKALKEISKLVETQLTSTGAIELYHNIELPLSILLAKMEVEGFPLDEAKLNLVKEEFTEKWEYYKERLHEVLGDINLNSSKQLAAIFYGEEGLLAKKGSSTASETLKPFAKDHPFINDLLGYRKYQKLLSTYIEGLLPYLKEDGKIHTYFNQANTATGRLSSSAPNLQNITVRDAEGRKVRECFYYKDESKILSLDYSQIELRILAALSKSQDYIDVFVNDRDIHSETAKTIYPFEEVTSEHRRKAKAVNFAIIYGSTIYGLAEQIDGTPQEAKEIINSFHEHYPEVKAYLDSLNESAFHQGYVSTLLGRRRYLKDLNSSVFALREAAKRAALNAPIQGTAADILKLAMVKCDEYLTKEAPEIKMVLTIHDEILFSGPEEELLKHKDKLKDIMEHVYPLDVPLKAEGGIAKTWAEAKD